MKKLFTLIVAICATTLAWAAEVEDDSGWCGREVSYTYESSTGTLTISGTGDMYDSAISQYGRDFPWHSYRSYINEVVIENGVTSIGEWAFEDCTGLTSITIPNSVTSIGEGEFSYCTGLTSMTVEATTPPLYTSNDDWYVVPDYNIPQYVPAGSVDAYKAAKEWKKFTNIQAIPATGVNEAAAENTAEKSEVKKIIDRNGIIYIEKDGTRYFLNGGKVK